MKGAGANLALRLVGIALALLGLANLNAHAADLPDPTRTPGVLNPEVTQATIHDTVCVKGWTKTIRPPAYYTNTLKKMQIEQYRYADSNPAHYEEDHRIPLSLGGHPSDARNLWPEPRKTEWGAKRKDQLEFALYRAVCDGAMPLVEAQKAFAGNWIDAYKRYARLRGRSAQEAAD